MKHTILLVTTLVLLMGSWAIGQPIETPSEGGGGGGSGDVTAGATITDNAIVRGDGGAKGIQETGILVDDSDNVSAMGTLACGAITSTAGVEVAAASAVDFSTRAELYSPADKKFEFCGAGATDCATFSTASTGLRFEGAGGSGFMELYLNNDSQDIFFGTNTAGGIAWSGNSDALVLSTAVNNAAFKGHILITEQGDRDASWAVSQVADPHLTICSADATDTDSFASLYHDKTNFVVESKTGGVTIAGSGLVPAKVTGDPCAGGTYPEGSIFYNDTSDYMCFCDGSNAVQMHNPAVTCF